MVGNKTFAADTAAGGGDGAVETDKPSASIVGNKPNGSHAAAGLQGALGVGGAAVAE